MTTAEPAEPAGRDQGGPAGQRPGAAPGQPAGPAGRGLRARHRRRVVRLAISLGVAAGLLYAVVAAAGGLPAAAAALRRTDPVWLAPALAAEAVSYLCYGWQLRRLSANGRVRWRAWLQIALVVYGLGSLTPAAPAEGIVFSALELQHRGMTRRRAGLLLVLGQWSQSWALILVLAASQIVAAAAGDLTDANIAVVIIMFSLLIVMTVPTVALLRRQSTAEHIAELTRFLPRRHGTSRAGLRAAGAAWHRDLRQLTGTARNCLVIFLAAIGGWAGDAACLWMALASVHVHIRPEIVLVAYTLAALAGWIPFLPGGIGAVEILIPALLHRFGVPVAAGLAGTLVWRALSLILPALAGLAAAAALRLARPHPPATGTRAARVRSGAAGRYRAPWGRTARGTPAMASARRPLPRQMVTSLWSPRPGPGAAGSGAGRKEPGREMDVSIVYESLFGNTRRVAEAIAAGVREADPGARVTLVRSADAGPGGNGPEPGSAQADLLIVGGPTHVLWMSSRRTRAQGLQAAEKAARKKGGHVEPERGADGPGVRDWLDRAPRARPGNRAAAFDTRLPYPLTGGAARPIARKLRRHGFRLANRPEGFIVTGTAGPLRAGELDRARAWGAALVAQSAPAAHVS